MLLVIAFKLLLDLKIFYLHAMEELWNNLQLLKVKMEPQIPLDLESSLLQVLTRNTASMILRLKISRNAMPPSTSIPSKLNLKQIANLKINVYLTSALISMMMYQNVPNLQLSSLLKYSVSNQLMKMLQREYQPCP